MPYEFPEIPTSSSYVKARGINFADIREKVNSKAEGMEILRSQPEMWQGLWCTNPDAGPSDQQVAYLVKQGYNFKPSGPEEGGDTRTWVYPKYDTGLGQASYTDPYSDTILKSLKDEDLTGSFKRLGRGEGLHDVPGIKLLGDIDPSDVQQRGLGDCWLMCSMSACAEFNGLIANLFTQKELSNEGRYTVKLFDLPSQVASLHERIANILVKVERSNQSQFVLAHSAKLTCLYCSDDYLHETFETSFPTSHPRCLTQQPQL